MPYSGSLAAAGPALLAAALLAGCDSLPSMRPALPLPAWTVEPTPDGGARMTAADSTGPILQMTCTDPGAPFVVHALRFTPIPGNLAFAFGTDSASYRFAVDPTAPGPGVTASGALPYNLVTSLLSDGAVYGVYGDQTIGPLVLPGDRADDFAAACAAN